jgi:hypothetical protein
MSSGRGQAFAWPFSFVTRMPGRFAMIARLLSGRFAAEMPRTGCQHEEKAT